MKKETADALCQALDSLSAEYERREDYLPAVGSAGGKKSTAIVLGDVQSLLVAVATAAILLAEHAKEMGWDLLGSETQGQFCKDVGRLAIQQDRTGSDIVVY